MCNHIPFFRLFGRYYVLERIFIDYYYTNHAKYHLVMCKIFFKLKYTSVKCDVYENYFNDFDINVNGQ